MSSPNGRITALRAWHLREETSHSDTFTCLPICHRIHGYTIRLLQYTSLRRERSTRLANRGIQPSVDTSKYCPTLTTDKFEIDEYLKGASIYTLLSFVYTSKRAFCQWSASIHRQQPLAEVQIAAEQLSVCDSTGVLTPDLRRYLGLATLKEMETSRDPDFGTKIYPF